MLARSLLRCPVARRSNTFRSHQICRVRRYSTPAAAATPANSSAGVLGAFTTELDKIAPRFEINGSQIRVLHTPSDFYDCLRTKISTAEKRIFLSTLYIGKEEHELIDTLRKALEAKPNLKLSILTDSLRGTREAPRPSCASILAPLIAEFGPDRVEIRMYHTPNLTGLRKKYVPKRINEGWGLQHMKLYGVDDEIIISGANLSNDYFTNRQDRYHVFSSKAITDYFYSLHDAVSRLSFLVQPDDGEAGFNLVWPANNMAPSPLDDPKKFVSASTASLYPLIKRKELPSKPSADTLVYPLSQLSQLLKPDTSTELPAMTSILEILASPMFAKSRWTFTAGYFNPDPSLTKLLINTASEKATVVTASPWANGFYKSKGVSGMLPDAYTLLARRFLDGVRRAGRQNAIELKEWRFGTVNEPGGWTYHAKGLWVTMPDEQKPSITMVGSSNYTKRSYSLDLEANTLIVTRNEELKSQLAAEELRLQEHANRVGIDDFTNVTRRVSIRVRIAMWLVSLSGGAL